MTTAEGIAVLVGATLLALVAMWVGWARRRARTAAARPHVPAVPDDPGTPLTPALEATYVSTTLAGRWLERVVAHGLGVRAAARVSVHPEGALIARRGAPDLFIGTDALRGVRLADGIAGKVVGGGRLVVIGWRHGGVELESGLLPRHAADRERFVAALTALSGRQHPEEESA